MIVRHCPDAAATRRAGEELAALLRPGDVVVLSGRLGAGKTTFVQGVARGLGVVERVTSPTFTLVRPHACRTVTGVETLYHADVYRAGSPAEVLDLAIGELVEEAAVAVVEWGETAAGAFGESVLTLTIDDEPDGERHLALEGVPGARRVGFESWGSP